MTIIPSRCIFILEFPGHKKRYFLVTVIETKNKLIAPNTYAFDSRNFWNYARFKQHNLDMNVRIWAIIQKFGIIKIFSDRSTIKSLETLQYLQVRRNPRLLGRISWEIVV